MTISLYMYMQYKYICTHKKKKKKNVSYKHDKTLHTISHF